MTETQKPLSAEELQERCDHLSKELTEAAIQEKISKESRKFWFEAANEANDRAEKAEADRDRWKERAEKFKMIAVGLDDDDREYETINNIAGCENNHWRTQLRLAIAELSNCPIRQETER